MTVFSSLFIYFLLAVSVLYVLVFSFLIVGWIRTKEYFPAQKNNFSNTKISIIIPVRNEEKNISNCLESLSQQDYPKELTEIIVIDDLSEDATESIAKAVLEKLFFEKFILLNSKKSGKKNAITFGIEKASGTLIITTDADCTFHKEWLSAIVSFYEKEQAQLIMAPVVFTNEKSIFEKIQSLEFSGLVATAGASAYFNFPLMCNGANLAYEKRIFEEVNGFEGNEKIDSGDDLFLMEKIRKVKSAKIKFLKSAKALVTTSALSDIKSFISQRKRWASKTVHLKNKVVLFIGAIIWLMNFLVLLTGCLIVYNSRFVALFFFLFIIKGIIDFLFLFLAVSFFKKRNYIAYALLLQVLYPIYVIYVSVFSRLGKVKWKNRVISK
ncbi:MAG TPA: glycosyltransferase [Bacteroidia bacterium]|nr:glycosyltransferase [Bacteroidia bacterium]